MGLALLGFVHAQIPAKFPSFQVLRTCSVTAHISVQNFCPKIEPFSVFLSCVGTLNKKINVKSNR